jgi:apolipoprotein N-acyltransferase
MEFPGDPQILTDLNKLKKQHPEASLLVLSEYTFTESLPDIVKKWCRSNQRYLIVGGKDFVDETKFFDTAFVIDSQGEIVFRQAKSMPIQFFNDGLPAREQKLWNSPWGKIGICICYDLSYTEVADRLVRLGAQALIVPTMDVVDWGRHEHELHARIAPIRAAEYGVPIFRVASSGISQLVDARGNVTATAPFPGEDAPISGWLEMGKPGQVPFDRVMAKASVWLTAFLLGWLAVSATFRQRVRQRFR